MRTPVPIVTVLEAQLMIVELLEHNPVFTVGYKAVLHIHTNVEECEITKLVCEVDPKTKAEKKVRFVKQVSSTRSGPVGDASPPLPPPTIVKISAKEDTGGRPVAMELSCVDEKACCMRAVAATVAHAPNAVLAGRDLHLPHRGREADLRHAVFRAAGAWTLHTARRGPHHCYRQGHQGAQSVQVRRLWAHAAAHTAQPPLGCALRTTEFEPTSPPRRQCIFSDMWRLGPHTPPDDAS
eukprot:362691-Chlamydomonas_euryale.AAC.1